MNGQKVIWVWLLFLLPSAGCVRAGFGEKELAQLQVTDGSIPDLRKFDAPPPGTYKVLTPFPDSGLQDIKTNDISTLDSSTWDAGVDTTVPDAMAKDVIQPDQAPKEPIVNPSFENLNGWQYEESDPKGSFSGNYTTAWASNGLSSYAINWDGVVDSTNYGRIKEQIRVPSQATLLTLQVRWWTSWGGVSQAAVKVGSVTLWSKLLNIGNPSPPRIENASINITSYAGQTVDLYLEYSPLSDGINGQGWVQFDNLVIQ